MKKPTQTLKKKTSNNLKADRAIHRVTFNPKRAPSAEVLRVPVPQHNNRDVLVSGSFSLIFDSEVSGHANSYIVNNVSRALVDRLAVKFVEMTTRTIMFMIYTSSMRTSPWLRMRGRACSENLLSLLIFERSDAMLKIRRNQELTMRIRPIMLIRINIGFHHEILKDHGVFPRVLSDEPLCELRVAPASNVVIGSDKTQLAYEFTNIHFDHEVIRSQELASEALSNYRNGKSFTYKHVISRFQVSVDKGLDTIINEASMFQGGQWRDLFFFYEPYVAGARDSEKEFNPDITEVKVIVDGIPNKVYSQGIETRDMWEEVFRRFGKENSAINATFGNIFALFVDLRSMRQWSSSSKMLSSASLTVSWKAWLINEITSHLQGTILPEEQIKARHKFFARRYNVDIWKSSHEQSTPPWHPDGAIRGSYEMIIFTPSSELTSEIVNFIHLWKSCLKIKVVSKMCKNCFLKSKLISKMTWYQG